MGPAKSKIRCEKCNKGMPQLEKRIRDSPIFESLRQWRRKVAEEENKPAYMVIFDRYILSIALIHPMSHEELRSCVGFATGSKGEIYGDAILDIVKNHDREGFDNSTCPLCEEGEHDGELLDNTAMEPLREPNNPSMANQWRVSKCRCCGQPLPGGGAIVGEGEPIDWFDEIIESKKRGGEISNFLWNLYNPKNREDAEGGIDAILRLKKRRSFFGGEVRVSRRPLSNGRTVEITMRHISQAKLADRFVEFVSESDIGRVTDGKDPQFPFIWRPSWIQPDGDTEGYWEIVFRHTYQD